MIIAVDDVTAYGKYTKFDNLNVIYVNVIIAVHNVTALKTKFGIPLVLHPEFVYIQMTCIIWHYLFEAILPRTLSGYSFWQ